MGRKRPNGKVQGCSVNRIGAVKVGSSALSFYATKDKASLGEEVRMLHEVSGWLR